MARQNHSNNIIISNNVTDEKSFLRLTKAENNLKYK